ncbi:hypothetical protein MAR_032379 [Mya arenaria]|uniref:Uncharacterized protein n=1 Tax=Mya arenaria TaxID=6604 RepID=A0ABY7F767_MYAAR|nr:hypothetical protein MAR_032379 [Mya arenaria]
MSLFDLASTQTSVTNVYDDEIRPMSQTTGDGPFEFSTSGQSSTDYLELKNSQIFVKFKIEKSDGTAMGLLRWIKSGLPIYFFKRCSRRCEEIRKHVQLQNASTFIQLLRTAEKWRRKSITIDTLDEPEDEVMKELKHVLEEGFSRGHVYDMNTVWSSYCRRKQESGKSVPSKYQTRKQSFYEDVKRTIGEKGQLAQRQTPQVMIQSCLNYLAKIRFCKK